MNRPFDFAQDRSGAALVMALAASILVGSLVPLALRAAIVHARLVSDTRWQVEAALMASSALASERLSRRALLDTIADGATWTAPVEVRPDGWTWATEATRIGATIRLVVSVNRLAADGTPFAARRTSLLLAHNPADTVRVLARRARF